MQFLANGIISGLAIALLATAWQLVYLPTRILFVALGAIYAFAPYAAATLLQLGWPPIAAYVVAVAAAAALGALCEALNHAPLTRRAASATAHFVTSLGLYMILVQALAMVWGAGTRTLRMGNEHAFQLGSITLLQSQLISAALAGGLLAAVVVVIMATPFGLRFRAMADNAEGFALLGYDLGRYRLICFAASAALAAVVSLLSAYATGFDPFLGLSSALVALAAVLIGGRVSFLGPIAAGLVLGIVRAMTVWALSPQWQDPITFGLLTVLLVTRPAGLLQSRTRVDQSAAA